MKNKVYDTDRIIGLETEIEKAIENNDPKLAQTLIAKKERIENRGNRTKINKKWKDIYEDDI